MSGLRMFWYLLTFRFGAFGCEAFGHRRGKLVSEVPIHNYIAKRYECPRCKASWSRTVKRA